MGLNNGYERVSAPDHPRAHHGQMYEHVLIAEAALGRLLEPHEHVHHVDEVRSNNENRNLVICDQALHKLIHQRMRARDACGHPDWRKCAFCKEYDAPENMVKRSSGAMEHAVCRKQYSDDYYRRNRTRVLRKQAERHRRRREA